MDPNDSGDMVFTTSTMRLQEWLEEGAETFENRMAASLVKAGHAAERWIVNGRNSKAIPLTVKSSGQLKKAWDEHQAEQQKEKADVHTKAKDHAQTDEPINGAVRRSLVGQGLSFALMARSDRIFTTQHNLSGTSSTSSRTLTNDQIKHR